MEVKNIESLQTKLFELIPENYYRKFASEISEVDLGGLTPSDEQFFDFKSENRHPCQTVLREFTFDKIT